MDDSGQQYTQAARRTRRIAGSVSTGVASSGSESVSASGCSAIPLALFSSDEGGGAGVAAVYLVASLAIAVVSRGIYIWLTNKPFWSPWLFVVAAVLALMSYGLQSAGDNVAAPTVVRALAGAVEPLARVT